MVSALDAPARPLRMFIGGAWVNAADSSTLPSIDPATEEVLAHLPAGGAADVDRAVEAAAAAAPGWAATSWPRRGTLLRELAARIRERAEELAQLDTADSGNPITGMRGDLRSTPPELEYFAGLAGEAKGDVLPPEPDRLTFSQREPYGVVGRIVPFNHPFKFAAGKVAAPLAAGNAVILKPAEHTSLSALELARLAEDLLPPGVLNVVTGLGAEVGAALAAHPGVPRVAFTGGVPTGRAVLRAGAETLKHVTLELGGKNPMIVFPDADPVQAGKAAIAAMNLRRSMGQSCQSSSRIFVHERIAGPFLDALVAEASGLTVGDPRRDDTDMGPLAYAAHYDRVCRYVQAGREDGATLAWGGHRPATLSRGYFLEPTIFADVEPGMRVAREEIFGPVVSVLEWRDYTEMLAAVNGLEYGLTANIWTDDLHLAHRTARLVESGLVWINGSGGKPIGAPFGGYRQSGLGKEGSLDELLSYTRGKTVITALFPDHGRI